MTDVVVLWWAELTERDKREVHAWWLDPGLPLPSVASRKYAEVLRPFPVADEQDPAAAVERFLAEQFGPRPVTGGLSH